MKIASLVILAVASSIVISPIPIAVVIVVSITLLICSKVKLSNFLTVTGLTLLSLAPFVVGQFLATNVNWISVLFIVLRSLSISWIILAALSPQSHTRTFAALGKLGCPQIIVQLLHITWRYVAILSNEWKRIFVAMKARGFRLRTNLASFQTVSYGVGAVFVHGAERSEEITKTMNARGYHGKLPLQIAWKARPLDWVYSAVIICFAGLIIFLAYR